MISWINTFLSRLITLASYICCTNGCSHVCKNSLDTDGLPFSVRGTTRPRLSICFASCGGDQISKPEKCFRRFSSFCFNFLFKSAALSKLTGTPFFVMWTSTGVSLHSISHTFHKSCSLSIGTCF